MAKTPFMYSMIKPIDLRDFSKISRGEWRWKTGEGSSFLSPSKGRIMKKKMTGREGGSRRKISHHDREGMLQYYVLQNTNHTRKF